MVIAATKVKQKVKTAPLQNQKNRLAIVVSKGTIDMLYPAFVLATTAPTMGMEVDLYFTFWGLRTLTKKGVKSAKIASVGNPGLPMPNIFGMLPGMTSLASGMMKKKIEKYWPTIPEMIKMIDTLIASGHAYESGGDVYFSIKSFPGYGSLSRHDVADLRSGERVEVDERKHDPLDFALWKAAKPDEPFWQSPWGEGRPGWHIECSAMARVYLGDEFDIHGGGSDLIFPHHENEIAQSEAATGERFAKYWVHNGMLNLGGEKMAKSTGHAVTLRNALDKWDPVAVRLFYLRTHYRKPLEYSESALRDAEASLARLRGFRRRVSGPVEDVPSPEVLDRFRDAMDDDLDVARALAVLFDAVREGNSLLDAGSTAGAILGAFDEIMAVLGLAVPVELEADDGSIAEFAATLGIADGGMEAILELRANARAAEDWATADKIRDGLSELKITIEDTADGARWHRD